MPIEGVVSRIEDLDPRWPRNADIVREGAQHIRNIKTALRQLDDDEAGIIKMFYGALADIPAGWVICDGQNGTPDMRNRVPVGTGDQYVLDAIGGADSVTLTTAQMPVHGHTGTASPAGAHNHGVTENSAGGHSHTGTTSTAGSHRHRQGGEADGAVFGNWGSQGGVQNDSSGLKPYTDYAGDHNHTFTTSTVAAHTHGVTLAAAVDHQHTVTVGNTGGGTSHENRMPYRALHFIMKLAS